MATQKPELDVLCACVCEREKGMGGVGGSSSLDFLTEGSLTPQLRKSSGCDPTAGGYGGWRCVCVGGSGGGGHNSTQPFTWPCIPSHHSVLLRKLVRGRREGEGAAAILKLVNIGRIQYLAALNRQVLTLF